MLYRHNKYSHQLLQRIILCLGLILFFIVPLSAQVEVKLKPFESHLNPLLLSSFKKPVKANTLLDKYIKPTKHELMYWPNYPLTPEQIAARDRKYDRPLGQQIAGDIIGGIIESSVNSLIYGKKQVVAVRPKF